MENKNLTSGAFRLGFDSQDELAFYEADKININKEISRINTAARDGAKRDFCPVCGKKQTSFCNSHSIPYFVLRNIAENGNVCLTLQDEMPLMNKSVGAKKAGTFHFICNDCDSKYFQDYENPAAYSGMPSQKVMAQIALKNYLQMLSKRYEEHELFRILGEKFPRQKNFTDEQTSIGLYDIDSYVKNLEYALKSVASNSKDRYYLYFFRKLDYVVPYAAQGAVSLLSDFDDTLINDLYFYSLDYEIKDMQIAIFPLKTSSIVLAFIRNGEKRYRKFFRQLKQLKEDDQLSALNYIIFAYTENVYLNPTLHKQLRHNQAFLDVCKQTTGYSTPYRVVPKDLIESMIADYSLSKRHDIPNLLSKEYALQ